MEPMKKLEATNTFRPEHFEACTVWKFDDRDDLWHPVYGPSDLPDSVDDIYFGVKFTTPKGVEFEGWINNPDSLYAIGIFFDNEDYIFNRMLQDRGLDKFNKIREKVKSDRIATVDDMFPIRYECNHEHKHPWVKNFSGSFDPF